MMTLPLAPAVRGIGVLVLAAIAAVTPRTPAQSNPPTLADAAARLQRGDAAGARPILESLVLRETTNARAWALLGVARQKTGALPEAIEAYQRSLAIAPGAPSVMYNLATAYALSHDPDRAFEWLGRVKATHRFDLTRLEADADVASLRGDARYRALLPAAADFAKPFVEPVTILREWDGEAPNDQFGWIARNIGDVDGDGIADVVTSAPTSHVGGEKAGRIYVYSTRSGRLLWTADGHAGDELGTGVEAAGDTDGDGTPDVIASAPGGGYATLYSGKDGRVLRTVHAEARTDNFGRHASGAGDINHDGYADVIVGAPGNSAAGTGAGRAYVYSGRDGRVLLTLTGERAGDAFGSTVAGAAGKSGDFLVVGAAKAGPASHGRVYVYRGLDAKPAFVIDADDTGAALGAMFVAVAGDVDGDGVADIYASDWSNGAKGPSTGRIYVHSGKDGRRLLTLTGETAGEGFGTSSSVAGDVNHDGRADFIVGAWQYAGAAASGGRAYLYSGKDGALLGTYTDRIPGDTLGFDSVGLGDVDGDGTIDFLITAAWSGIHGFHSGRVFVISSGVGASRVKS